MKVQGWLAVVLLLIPGCAAYKELEPEPDLAALERGYIELKDGKDHFELDEGNKYFLRFPSPPQENFTLVLVTQAKPLLSSYLTSTFNDGRGPITTIADQTVTSDSISAFAINPVVTGYQWVIEKVTQDIVLRLRYRYVPLWRYTFESKYAEYRTVLADNLIDRSTYRSLDVGFDADALDVTRERALVQERTARIQTMKNQLEQIEKIFPKNIAASKDTAYEQYLALRRASDEELAFQGDYSTILELFEKERSTRGNTSAFIEAAPYFAGIVSQRGRFPQGVLRKSSQVLSKRLTEVAPYLDDLLRNKSDLTPISPNPSYGDIEELYRSGGQSMPPDLQNLVRFVNRFNVEVKSLEASDRQFDALVAYFNRNIESPGSSFYADLASRAAEVRSSLPEPQASRFPGFGRYNCALRLERELTRATNRANDLQTMYQSARTVSSLISDRSWQSAEGSLRGLHTEAGLSGSPEISAQRKTLVEHFEGEIFSAVKSTSHQRIDAFIKAHETVIDNVPQLYADSSFQPVYQITFSSRGANDLIQKRSQVQDYLDQIRYFQFPETSIRSIYAEFTGNMRNRGVEKARAIVEHGKFYKGADEQIKGLIIECNVEAAKWIVHPKEYRKLFALPVTSNPQGVNEYMFRIRLKIPSEAQFPVFDVNLKLPQDIAEKAGKEQWFESMTIDKVPLKNEGRFRITSPTAENNYETLITPVQMDKEGKNILEVRFKYPGFRVFDVSVMAQVPIIRKN